MAYFSGEDLNSSERFVYIYTNIQQPEMEQIIHSTMTSLGYKHIGLGVYEYGDRAMRLILGGFYKYFKFKVTLDASDPKGIKVGLKKESSGMSGGLLGVKKMSNEMKRLKEVFRNI